MDADEIAAAARRAVAAGSVRLREVRFLDPPNPESVSVREGAADFRATRTSMETVVEGTSWATILELALARWPWLTDEEQPNDAPNRVVHAGTQGFFGYGGLWASGPGDPHAGRRHPADPAWIIGALAETEWAEGRASRGTDPAGSRRAAFRLAVDEATGRELKPGAERARTVGIVGEVCVDSQGRLCAVLGTEVERLTRRPRLPHPELPGSRTWRSLELSEFGVPVSIDLPVVTEDADAGDDRPLVLSLIETAWELRRRKRAYERRLAADGAAAANAAGAANAAAETLPSRRSRR